MPVKLPIIFSLFFACTIYFGFSQHSKIVDAPPVDYMLADKLYADAEKLSASADFDDTKALQQEKLNRESLLLFKKLLSKKRPALSDSLLFHCYLKAALLLHFFDSLSPAKAFYLQAILIKEKLPAMKDSFFFKPYLFTGSIFYSQNQYDSAIFYYKKAEQIAGKYNNQLEEIERLYNRMGVMNYETGNYRLANNYFQKAISLLSPANPSYDDLLINYKMNIASLLIKLEDYDRADTVFKSILPFKVHVNEINHNIGIIQLRMKHYAAALTNFRKVHYDHNLKTIELYYNMAEAFSGLQQKDSSVFYIGKAVSENKNINGNKKNSSLGLALKFIGDEKINNNQPGAAIVYYQQAVGQFYPGFNDTGLYAVPVKYTGIFSYINLFNTLIAKGDALRKLYQQLPDRPNLQASFNAYKSAFELADYVAKTYDSDEARLFLNKIKYTAHDKAIHASLLMYELTANKDYLEEAYFFDQRNKAAVLTLALQESSMKKEAGVPQELLEKQASIRSVITRLSIKANHITDSTILSEINNEIRDNEIKLSGILQQINSDPAYAGLGTSIPIPGVKKLQEMLDDKTTLLSYHLAENELLILYIDKHDFGYVKHAVGDSFAKSIEDFINSLHNMNQAERYTGAVPATNLYRYLIDPVANHIAHSTRLIIVPDDELNYIPFEALTDGDKKYLVQSYAIQYQYSTALLHLNKTTVNSDNYSLGFAPFTNDIAGSNYQKLPYSKEELSQLKGKVFYDGEATKQHFIEYANQYGIVQLATHAAANDSQPLKSFIAFYPQQKDSVDEHTLYAQEVYNLRLDSIQLVILSACETGTGKLIRGEGLMSITRAFAYAGCPNIITSLWKAADKTTAFITQRLNFYLGKGYSKDKALQMAKIDLLNSNDIAPGLKTPNYWAHLIFIGNYEPAANSFQWWWLATGIVIVIICYFFYKKNSRGGTAAMIVRTGRII